MKDTMIRFLKSIHIENVDSFDIDFDMVGRNRFNREQVDMVIVKNTPWKYYLLREFQDGLETITYPYLLRFSYINRPTSRNAIELFDDWYQTLYHVPASEIETSAPSEDKMNFICYSNSQKSKLESLVKDYQDFLDFLGYEVLVDIEEVKQEENEVLNECNEPSITDPIFPEKKEENTIEDELPFVNDEIKKETKEPEPVVEQKPSAPVQEEKEIIKSENDDPLDSADVAALIQKEKEAMNDDVENALLAMMRENAKQMAAERLRAKLNKRGNYMPIDNIDSINVNSGSVDFSAKTFSVETKDTSFGTRYTIGFFDVHGGAIYGSMKANKAVDADFVSHLSWGTNVRVRGVAYFDDHINGLAFRIHYIDLLPPDEIEKEDFDKNRVELHLHSNYSAMDGVTKMMDYAKYAKALGHTAMAITDHAVVQGFPDAQAAEKATGVKMLYGTEFYMVDDKQTYVFNPSKDILKKSTFVVLDLETTGLSCVYNDIIEFGAVKVVKGLITERLDILIDPQKPLPQKIIDITDITDEMLEGQPTIKEAMPRILEFCKDSILVTHNANFDFSFLQEALRKLGQPILENPVIDTLALSRYLFPESRNHRLGSLCRNMDVFYDEESAHRADYDAQVLNDVWQPMLDIITKNNINMTHEELGNLETPQSLLKHIRPSHVVAIAKNRAGLKDLYKLVSFSHIDYLAEVPKLPRSLLEKYRSNLFVGSACLNGEVFNTARYYNKDRLKDTIAFYDYIEVQPLDNYSILVDMKDNTEEEIIQFTKDIVECADAMGKPVCATGDVHYSQRDRKQFRDVYIYAKGIGNTNHPLNPYARSKMPYFENPNQHYRTTREMLDAFAFLGDDKAYEIVVTNTNTIADQIEHILPVPNDHLYTPTIENCEENLRNMCFNNAKALYGDPLPELIETRLNTELNGIIGNGYSVIYYIAHCLIKKANDDGYIVGSRGSVGSSFVATMSNITEVNALPPHYRCPHCKHLEWTSETMPDILSGFDLPEKNCPVCGTPMVHDGQNIPFETFLGFNADKVPDIDLNFPGDYQAKAHNYTKVLLGEDNVFRAGTIGTVAEKTAFGFARGFIERSGFNPDTYSRAKIAYLASGCVDVKRTTGQHPGGIVVVPKDHDVYDFTPVQYPADDLDATWKTTHFDFHSIHDTILKLDLLGHVDPMALKMMCDLTGIDLHKIPMNDPKVLSLFSCPDALGMKNDYLDSKTGALAIPEFGTDFVRGMLEQTHPKTFTDLVIISGLSHGTDVWNNNAEDLIKNGTATLKEVIGCRDDIMTYLIRMGLPSGMSFKIMEDVRKGRGLKEEYLACMKEHNVPQYYIDSCNKIKYMFPKGHAVAYVTMAIRVGYFKVYYPLEFYATFFSVRSDQYDIVTMIKGRQAIIDKMEELKGKSKTEKLSTKEGDQLKTLNIALEMVQRGYNFSNIDLYRSDASKFVVDHENKALIPPFITVDQLGENNAITVVEARKEGKFLSKENLLRRTKLTTTNVQALSDMGVLDELDETDQILLF